MMSLIEETMYDGMVECGIATTEEMGLVKAIRGGEWIDVLKDILFVRTGYRTWKQFIEEEYSEDEEGPEEEEDDTDEIDKLAEGLFARGIKFSCAPLYDGYKIDCPMLGFVVICHSGSYGGHLGLLEAMGIYCENSYGEVDGYLTAEEILKCIDEETP